MESQYIDTNSGCPATLPAARSEQTFDLFAYCYSDRVALLPQLTKAFTQTGGWVLERRTVSAAAMDFRFEIQLGAVLELYSALAGMGLELTRASHSTLTDLCTCRKHSGFSPQPNQVLTFRLEISFLADVTLHSILATGANHA